MAETGKSARLKGFLSKTSGGLVPTRVQIPSPAPGGRMTKKLRIEFRYVDKNTCSRCRTTDKNVGKTVQGLRKALRESGIAVDLKTTKLPISKLAQSNSILINGKDIEELVSKKRNIRSSACRGCSEIIESPCECRAYIYRGKKHSYVPQAMIREAISKFTESRI